RRSLARRDRDGRPRRGLGQGRPFRTHRREYLRPRADRIALAPRLDTAVCHCGSARAAVGTVRARALGVQMDKLRGNRNQVSASGTRTLVALALQLAALAALSL